MSVDFTGAVCESCGAVLPVGSWPFCPHGEYRGGIVPDELVGGFAQENFSDQVEVFYSKKAMLKRADELGLQPFVKHAGEHEKHLTNWVAGATEKQLRDAAVLLSRGAEKHAASRANCETLKTHTTEFTIPGVTVEVEC